MEWGSFFLKVDEQSTAQTGPGWTGEPSRDVSPPSLSATHHGALARLSSVFHFPSCLRSLLISSKNLSDPEELPRVRVRPRANWDFGTHFTTLTSAVAGCVHNYSDPVFWATAIMLSGKHSG